MTDVWESAWDRLSETFRRVASSLSSSCPIHMAGELAMTVRAMTRLSQLLPAHKWHELEHSISMAEQIRHWTNALPTHPQPNRSDAVGCAGRSGMHCLTDQGGTVGKSPAFCCR
jgi:hypothetical protein